MGNRAVARSFTSLVWRAATGPGSPLRSARVRAHYKALALRRLWTEHLEPHRHVIACGGAPEASPASAVVDSVRSHGGLDRLVVVCGGPSARTMPRSQRALYVSTNGSFELVRGLPHVYFVADGLYLHRYLKRGVPVDGWLGTVLRIESSGSSSNPALIQTVEAYKRRFRRTRPEVFGADTASEPQYRANFELWESAIRSQLGIKFKQFNSGFGAVQIGFWLAAELGLPMEIYGLDAGEGGFVHFDGSPSVSNSVSGDRVRSKLAELLTSLYGQSAVPVSNMSYFMCNAPQP